MSVSLVIRGGLVVDPLSETKRIASVLIDGNHCAGICDDSKEPEAKQTIDASGCIVMPGLIDSHIHVFYGGTENGVNPDLTLLPMGVTAGIDQGSAGSGNFELFYDSVISRSKAHIFAMLNISTQGLITSTYPENLDPRFTNVGAIQRLFERYKDTLCGIKVRISKEIVGELGLKPLENAINVSGKIGTRVAVHTTNPSAPVSEFIKLFRKDDIYAHTFQQRGFSILGENGKVLPEVYEARKRGVIFDSSDARVHYLYPVIKEALKEGFTPDTISTDLVQGSCFQPGVFGLPRIMSKYLELGLPLMDVVRAVTARPAAILNKQGVLGTLQEGALADVAIFKKTVANSPITDRVGNTVVLKNLLIPQCTILNGKVVFRQFNF